MQIITINNDIHGANFFEKLIFFSEIVGILLTISSPIMPKLNKFKYEFCKKEKLNWKYKNKGSKLNPAAAGDGTPVKYTDESIGLLVM